MGCSSFHTKNYPMSVPHLYRQLPVSCKSAHLALASQPWAVLSDVPPSLQIQTFEIYGQRFGGIEPHFKDYKSAAFELIRSHLRDAQALNCQKCLESALLVQLRPWQENLLHQWWLFSSKSEP